eukprot:TRINITY_DN3367_c0_g4_i1.p1 TRINITY_DN3367_c0_g4~~TRINITY_DN3367_c0_g4_i1.p1  ORF type:complete len:237 (-),score=38.13 TRINITY_DN3367_c0_g4_i1:480-1190(-)
MQQVDEKKELRHCSSSISLRSGSSASECTRTTVSSAAYADTLSLKFRSSQRWADIDLDDDEIDEAFVLQLQNGLVAEAEDSTFDDCGAPSETDGVPNRAASSQKADNMSLCSPSEVSPGTPTAWQTKMPDVGDPNLQWPQFFDDQCTNQMIPPAQICWTMPVVPPPPSPWQGNLPACASAGSVGHPLTCNAPCRFNSGGRSCKDAAACTHCHLCTWSRAAKRVHAQRVRAPSLVMY